MTKPTPADWRAHTLSRIHELMHEADPDIIVEQKYKMPSNPGGIPVWYKDGMICTGETYQKHLRLTFAKGPELKAHDPKGLINTYRAIVIKEDDTLDEAAFIELIRAAVALNNQIKSKTKH